MSTRNKLELLIDEIRSLGGVSDTDYIIYRLMDGDDISEAFEGVSFLEDVDWPEMHDKVEAFLTQRGYEHLDSEGGHEGGGEYCYGVIKLDNEYYRAEWEYYSYNGCEYSGISSTVKQVTPKQKTITVYE